MMDPRSRDIWMDSDADGLRDYVRREWPQLADALDEEADQLQALSIPAGQYTYCKEPCFARYPKGSDLWHILGPEDIVVPGAIVAVYNNAEKEVTHVSVLRIVASRLVAKRDGSYVTYVMASFDRTVKED